jgi:midasin
MDDQNESGGEEEEEEESNNMDNIEHIDESMKPGTIIKDGHEKFAMLTSMTSEASSRLCEQLRLILEPTLATKLKGDYRTGKRINMRKIIPYIASSFKKDKIWLRRKKPSKREYQILLVIDDSKSMASAGDVSKASPGELACESMVTLANALTRLEVGELGILSFGCDETKVVHDLGTPFSADAGASVLETLTFGQESTGAVKSSGMTTCVKQIFNYFVEARKHGGSSTNVNHLQIAFIITDAIFDDDSRKHVPYWIRRATEQNQLIVMIMIDKEGQGTKKGIASLKRVKYVKGRPTFVSYLDDYPFPYYINVGNVEEVPEVIADALRQWFQLINS